MLNIGVISGGDLAADALIYKPPDNRLLNYLGQNIQRANEMIGSYSNMFVNTVQDMYNRFSNDTVRLYNKLVLQNSGMHLNQDVVHLVDYDNLHMANLAMQRYILAEPNLGEKHRKGMCYGYQDTYVPSQDNVYGKDTLEYGRVMDGVLQFDENGEGFIETYSQDDSFIYKDDLHYLDQLSILKTWEYVSRMMSEGIDPTDPLLGEL